MENRRYIIEGKVQGVFFRRSTLEYVKHHTPAIRGYVKNLNDGSVEVIASGSIDDINNLEEFLKEGPETAIVEKVTLVEYPQIVNEKDFQMA